MHDLCCRALLYKEFQPFEYVFKYGDVGDAYYILLSGEA